MRKYYTTHLVKSEDLNHHGTLFAARTASWFVEAAFACAACEHGDPSEIVCRNIHGMSFSSPVNCGDIVRFTARVVHVGTTSLMVHVDVVSELTGKKAVDGCLTFVTIDHATGKKKPHGIVLDAPEDEDEAQQRRDAEALRAKA
ncbi:MAG: acyl-CoA thioesterase [Oscillospiraceae bacterium]